MKFILCLLAVLFFDGLGNIAFGATRKNETVELEKIIITSKRTPSGLGEISGDVLVITEEEIKTFPAQDLGEVLKYVAGVDVRPRQGFGRANVISIRGANPRQVRVMIDGIPLNTQTGGRVNVSMIPIENIARIEVIKGAASSAWGSSLGGVVNVITKDTGDTLIPKGSVTSILSEFHTKKENFDLSGRLGKLGYYIFSSYMESGGEGSRDDVLEKKVFGKTSYDLEDMGKITASFGYSGADVNSGAYPTDESWAAQPYRLRYGKIGWTAKFKDMDINAELKSSRQDILTKWCLTTANNDSPWWFPSLRYEDILYQLSVRLAMPHGDRGLLVLGGDFDRATVKSDYYLRIAKNLNTQAPYINYTLNQDPWDFNLGLRYDYNSEFGDEFSPQAGAVYHVNDTSNTLLRVNVARAFNAPPLLWKYMENIPIFFTTNSPDIKAERSWAYEMGLESEPTDRIWWKFSLYRADITDAIAIDRNDAGLFYQRNFQKFRRQGMEIQSKTKLLYGFEFFLNGGFNDAENTATGERVMDGDKARKSLHTGLIYNNEKGLTGSILGNFDNWNEPGANQPNDKKMIYDMKVSREFKHYAIFLNIYNLTNSKYWSHQDFPIALRYFEGGTTIKW